MEQQDKAKTAPVKKGERSRALLLEAALRIIGMSGVDAVTHRSVAEEAGLTRGAVTYHFESRDQILLQAFLHYIDTVHKLFEEVSSDIIDDGVDGVVDALVRYHTHEFLDPGRVLAEYELILFAARNEEIGRAVRAWEDQLIDRLQMRLAEAGAVAPHKTAPLLLAIFRAFELESLTKRNASPHDLRDRLRAVIGA